MRALTAIIVAAALAGAVSATGLGVGSLSVSPSTVPLGSTFTVSGCGYPVPSAIVFEVVGPKKATPAIDYFTSGEPVGPDGCFSETWIASWSVAGAFELFSSYRDAKGTHKAAVVKFTVTAGP